MVMTATEFIEQLENILTQRDGEDVEIRMDVDFIGHHSVINVMLRDDLYGESEQDVVMLQSLECVEAMEKFDPRFVCPANAYLN
jgi:hypothetical protein